MTNRFASLFGRLDVRVKVLIGLSTAVCVFLPIRGLLILSGAILLVLTGGGVADDAVRSVYRIRWVLLFLFVVDWVVVDVLFAATVSLRFMLLTVSLLLFTGTTSHEELYSLLRWLRVPSPAAFSLVTGLRSVHIVSGEWRSIKEAQKVRGLQHRFRLSGIREIRQSIGTLLPLCIPAIVLSVRRSWSITEAAYLRGFDEREPERIPMPAIRPVDAIIVTVWSGFIVALIRGFT
jgi:energy-coupling factor transporter transmembrane protein EcfT